MKSATFIDPELQWQMEEDGYIIIRNFLNSFEIEQVKKLFEIHYNHNEHPGILWNSLFDVPKDRSRALSDQLLAILKPNLEKYLKDYICLAATFLVKKATSDSAVNIHRDYTVQDELNFSYHNCWLPMVDTTLQNGQLYVLKKSHKFFNYPLPQRTAWSYIEHEKLLVEYCDFIDAKAGDLIIYNDKMLHGSSDNLTPNIRPVVHFGLQHPESKFLYHYLNPETNEVTVYDVPFTFFFEGAWGNQDGHFPVFKKFQYNPPILTKNEITEWLNTNVGKTPAISTTTVSKMKKLLDIFR